MAIKLNPDFTEAYQNMASTYILLGQYQGAINACNKAISLNPDSAIAYSDLGESLYFLGRHKESIDSCKKSIELNPNFSSVHFVFGNNYIALGDFNEATECYQDVITIEPNFVEEQTKYLTDPKNDFKNLPKSYIIKEHYNIGMFYYLLGDRDSALNRYEVLKTLDENMANELLKIINKDNYEK